MASTFLVDTDVVIDYLRELPLAVSWWESLAEKPCLSVITVAELYAGVREGPERQKLDEFTSVVSIIDVNLGIAASAGLRVRQFRKSHNVLLPDAMIAATAEALGLRLVTLNQKHFPMLSDVLVPYQKT